MTEITQRVPADTERVRRAPGRELHHDSAEPGMESGQELIVIANAFAVL
jgi:hypothetical protein